MKVKYREMITLNERAEMAEEAETIRESLEETREALEGAREAVNRIEWVLGLSKYFNENKEISQIYDNILELQEKVENIKKI